ALAISVAGITMAGMSPGIYPQISVDGLSVVADDGTMALENFTLKPFDLSGVIATLETAPELVDESWFEANGRDLLPSFEGFSFSGLSMDIEDQDNEGERIIADVAEFDLSLGQYLNGIPTAL